MKFKLMLFSIVLSCLLVFSGCSKDDGTDDQGDPKTSNQADIPQVDDAVNKFMTNFNVPGVSVAITKGEKLVYAKSYGMADKSANHAVTNNSLFRLASVSKVITALAILRLQEDGKLTLEQKVFGTNGILGTTYGSQPYGNYVTDITVNQLLHHTSGGWGNSNNDPMFKDPSISQDDLISWTLDNLPVTRAPGTHFDYSNFGYCLLGRVIEKVSGKSYEKYVQQNVLEPAGVTGMKIAGNSEADRKANEVIYYGQSGENPYIYNISRMDAHGGWISSATDMARLLVHFDGFNNKPDILSSNGIKTLTTPTAANQNYACGIAVNNANNWWHSGSLPGTSTEFVRAGNGFNWVVLCNTRSNSNAFTTALDQLIWIAVGDNTTEWQDIDEF